jgi:hypothetical protein
MPLDVYERLILDAAVVDGFQIMFFVVVILVRPRRCHRHHCYVDAISNIYYLNHHHYSTFHGAKGCRHCHAIHHHHNCCHLPIPFVVGWCRFVVVSLLLLVVVIISTEVYCCFSINPELT